MSWTQITFDVPEPLKDAVIGVLTEDGVAGVWESEAESTPGLTRLVVYLKNLQGLARIVEQIGLIFFRAGRNLPAIAQSEVDERDWTEEWKKSYSSFEIAEEFFIVPSWEDAACPNGRMAIRIDPGQAFGTGTHETTQLTMEAMERWVEAHHLVLDVGTGSGILSIASRLLGARDVLACDVDPVAVQVARANIARNSEPEGWAFCGSVDCVPDRSIHLLLGNLTADVIIDLFPEFHRVLLPQGLAILSGILQEQREDILDLLRRFRYSIHEELSRGEWLALVVEKHGD